MSTGLYLTFRRFPQTAFAKEYDIVYRIRLSRANLNRQLEHAVMSTVLEGLRPRLARKEYGMSRSSRLGG